MGGHQEIIISLEAMHWLLTELEGVDAKTFFLLF